MPTIPEIARQMFVPSRLIGERGKVRDRILLPDSTLIGQLATDRISVFDFVLPATVPQKGEVLTALDVYWYTVLRNECLFDMVAFGSHTKPYLPPELADKSDIHRRLTIARRLSMIDREAIPRGFLTGSGWQVYCETAPNHTVCGISLPPRLRDGDELPEPLFTATTKAKEGHDKHIDATTVGPEIREASLRLYRKAREIAGERGIIIADTKFEFGRDETGKLVCGDERLTPDSSRYWSFAEWQKSRHGEKVAPPPAFDKEFVRAWAKTRGIDKLDPQDPAHLSVVHGLNIPSDIIWRTNRLYRYIFFLLTTMRLETFQTTVMHIPTRLPKVEIVIGSTSDLAQTDSGLEMFEAANVPYTLHAISCHRNPDELRQYAKAMRPETSVVIAGAGKAAALPGVLQSWLAHYGKAHIPVVGVGFRGKTEVADHAAVFGIEELPGQPVILDTRSGGRPFFGPDGFRRACEAVIHDEFLAPVVPSKEPSFFLRRKA